MPNFGEGYSDHEIAAVVNYLTGRFGDPPGTHLEIGGMADGEIDISAPHGFHRLGGFARLGEY
jgi:hypothetical protein